MVATFAGRAEAAVVYLEKAAEVDVRIENRPALAISRAHLATALVARGKPGDLARARALLAQAIDAARSMDMPVRVAQWT